MKIALFSDVHANLPAFEAMLADMEKHEIDALYCLGDLVGYHVSPNEIIEEIRSRKISTLAGNHDVKVKLPYVVPTEESLLKRYAYEIVSEASRHYLHALPAQIRLSFQLKNEVVALLLVHGSPRKNDEYMLEDMDEQELIGMMDDAKAQIVCCGHSHKPYHRIVTDDSGKARHVVNVGSVGKPKDGDPRGCYVILELLTDSEYLTPSTLKTTFVRFDYDIEKAVAELDNSPLPNDLITRLRQAF
jgi:predicted phosphodiesterase